VLRPCQTHVRSASRAAAAAAAAAVAAVAAAAALSVAYRRAILHQITHLTEGVNLIRPNDLVSVFRGSFEAGRLAAGTMQITRRRRAGVSRRFRSFQVINRSRVHKRTTYGQPTASASASVVCIPARRKQDRPDGRVIISRGSLRHRARRHL